MTKTSPKSSILKSPIFVPGNHTIDDVDKNDIAILSANENSLRYSKNIEQVLSSIALNCYPSSGVGELRKEIAKIHNLNENNIVCGNGSDEILQLLVHSYVGEGDEVLYPEHGFLI